jgi:GAF domain-containing protein
VVGTPILVDGKLWGVMLVGSVQREPLPKRTDSRIEAFTELVATAIANAAARTEMRRLAEEQAGLRRVATLVARGVEQEEIFAAVAEEIALVSHVATGFVMRFEPDGTATVVAKRGIYDELLPVGTNWPLDGDSVTARVYRTGRPARVDGRGGAPGAIYGAMPEGLVFTTAGAKHSRGVLPFRLRSR